MVPHSSIGCAHVVLENRTKCHYKFQVQHQYTGNDIESSEWTYFAPGEKKTIMDVRFRYGLTTTGRNNWIIRGQRLIRDQHSGGFIPESEWRCGREFGGDGKIHTLKQQDAGKEVFIDIYPSSVQFYSPTRESSTSWSMGRWSFTEILSPLLRCFRKKDILPCKRSIADKPNVSYNLIHNMANESMT